MTFEEFFTRKRIDILALQKAEPALFSEFRTHFEQMGEKSFDHTKKYWFNRLRHSYHLAPEAKPERVHIPNPLAEQTVTESLSETTEAPKPAPRIGFVPKFKASNMAKLPVEETKAEEKPVVEDIPAAAEPPKSAPKMGFTPKFRAANLPKPAEAEKKEEEKPAEEKPVEPMEATAPKLGFTPKFRAANPPKPVEAEKKEEEKPVEEKSSESTEASGPKPAYKPRFNMKNIPPKKEE